MRVIVFGSTGMVGQGVVRECSQDPDVSEILAVVRKASEKPAPKVREIVHSDFLDYASISSQLGGLDACFFCLGTTSAGKTEKDYRTVTFDYTMAAARSLIEKSPGMTFVYVSGEGADSTEKGRVMWARVRGQLENALLRMPFKAVYVVRPGVIQPLHGIRSRTPLYNNLYVVLRPVVSFLRLSFPKTITTTEEIGQAMLLLAKRGDSKKVLRNRDLNRIVTEA